MLKISAIDRYWVRVKSKLSLKKDTGNCPGGAMGNPPPDNAGVYDV
jgi:hypothetical protein